METKFNFKSQPCTSRSQSERLLALGLKKETADCGHFYGIVEHEEYEDWETIILDDYGWESHWDVTDEEIPAWSLDRLREMLNKSGVTISFVERDTSIIVERYGVFQNVFEIWDNVYDNICDAVEWLIKERHFNKEYLE